VVALSAEWLVEIRVSRFEVCLERGGDHGDHHGGFSELFL
jgi:hypothetical protein